jgi:hypothetical protein
VQAHVQVDKRQIPALLGREDFCRASHAGHPIQLFVRAVFASNHSRGGRFHSSAAWFKTKYINFHAVSSDGKCPRVLTALRSFEFSASIAFVTGMRIAVPTHLAGTA